MTLFCKIWKSQIRNVHVVFVRKLCSNTPQSERRPRWTLRKRVAVVVSFMAGADPPGPVRTGKKQARVCLHNIPNFCPKGLLRRDPSNFRVRLSVVCLSVCHTQFRSGNPPKPLGGVSVRVQKQVRLGHLTDYRRNPKYRRKTCK